MSKHKYLPNNVLFDDDDEVENETSIKSFRRRIPSPQPKSVPNLRGSHIPDLDQQKQLMQKKLEIEQKTLQSVSRSIALLEDAEDAGIRAAKELACQGEQLQNTNLSLDEVDANLKKSKKRIKGIKSVFHEFKNYVSSNSPPPLRHKASPSSGAIPSSKSKFYKSTDGLSLKTTTKDNLDSQPATLHHNIINNQTPSGSHTNSAQVEDILEANCNKITLHLARLKGIGLEIGQHIEQQNELIDTIQNKVEVADIKIGKQNKEMNKILGK